MRIFTCTALCRATALAALVCLPALAGGWEAERLADTLWRLKLNDTGDGEIGLTFLCSRYRDAGEADALGVPPALLLTWQLHARVRYGDRTADGGWRASRSVNLWEHGRILGNALHLLNAETQGARYAVVPGDGVSIRVPTAGFGTAWRVFAAGCMAMADAEG